MTATNQTQLDFAKFTDTRRVKWWFDQLTFQKYQKFKFTLKNLYYKIKESLQKWYKRIKRKFS